VAIAGYPPAQHFLSDLGMEAEVVSSTDARVRLRVTPHITTADGGVRAGVLATLVDVVGGSAALRALAPDWLATADLALEMVRPATGPWVEARGSVVRRGKTVLVVEALVFNVDADGNQVVGTDGAEVGVAGGPAAPVAWATMTFAVLPARPAAPTSTATSTATATTGINPDLPTRWSFTGAGLDRPVVEALSIAVVDPARGRVSMPVHPYLFNSFGAVQGGVMALVGEVAGAAAVAAVGGTGADSTVVTGLQVAYLALGRVGPIVSRARVLEAGEQGIGGSAVIELLDEGADGRVTTVINVGTAVVDAGGPAVGGE
jgi:uncharacterized protein (TIGR00369 family)